MVFARARVILLKQRVLTIHELGVLTIQLAIDAAGRGAADSICRNLARTL
jgi:hypothetical protein